MKPVLLATRTFEYADQRAFAAASSDCNPMHMDEAFARRTQAGALVVHGIHTLLWAGDELARQAADMPIGGVRCRFHQPLFVGDRAELWIGQRSPEKLQAEITTAGVRIASITFTREARLPGFAAGSPPEATFCPETPFAPELDAMAGLSGRALPLGAASGAGGLFPDLERRVGTTPLSGLMGTSQIVGMICPGLNSLYASLDVSLQGPVTKGVAFAVDRVDPRFRLLTLKVEGSGIAGRVEAFARLAPPRQSIDAIPGRVSPDALRGHTALIVGGSRGLGELTAKVIALAGGRPTITYYRERGEAARVAAEIKEAGGACDVIRYDIAEPAMAQLPRGGPVVSHAYYFATPKIFLRKAELFDPSLLARFQAYYVNGFHDLCQALTAQAEGSVRVFYPSSVAIEEGVSNIAEYAMAKAAGETLCDYMNRFMGGVEILRERLPRTMTDQTATVGVAAAADALDVMLPLIAKLHGVIFPAEDA